MNLRSIHRWVSNPFAITIICFAILFSNLNFVRGLPDLKAGVDFTGEEMFRGVFFSSGRYADLIPELKEFKLTNFTSDKALLAKSAATENEVVNKISTASPEYFNNFKQALLSRNHVTIQNALIGGKGLVVSAFEGIGITRDKPAEDRLAQELGKKIDLSKANAAEISAAVKSVAAEQDGPIVIEGYPIIWIWYVFMIIVAVVTFSSSVNEMKSQSLYFDELVNSIASRS